MPFELIMLVFMLETIATGITAAMAGVLILIDSGDGFAGDSDKQI